MPTCPAGHHSTADDFCDTCGAPIVAQPAPPQAAQAAGASDARTCPNCGARNVASSLFCESCGYDFTTGTPPRGSEAPVPSAVALLDLDEPAPVAQDAHAARPQPGAHPTAEPQPPAAGEPEAEPAGGASERKPDQPLAEDPQPSEPQDGEPQEGEQQHGPQPHGPQPGGPQPHGPQPHGPQPGAPAEAGPAFVAEVWVDPDWYAAQDPSEPMPSPGLPRVVALPAAGALIGRTSRSRGIHPEIDCEPDSSVSRRHARLSSDGRRWWVEDLDSANGTFVGSGADLPTTPARGKVEVVGDARIYVGGWTRIVVRRAAPGELESL